MSRTIGIAADGHFAFPMFQQHLPASGLNPADLAAAIGNALRREETLVNPIRYGSHSAVTIAEDHSRLRSFAHHFRTPRRDPARIATARRRYEVSRERSGHADSPSRSRRRDGSLVVIHHR